MFFLPYLKEDSRACQEGSTWALLFFPGKCQCTRGVFLDSPIANATQSSFGEGLFYSSWSSLSSSKVMLTVVKFRGFVRFYFFPTKWVMGSLRLSSDRLHFDSGFNCDLLLPEVNESRARAGQQVKGWVGYGSGSRTAEIGVSQGA